jgi:hypothetical protein
MTMKRYYTLVIRDEDNRWYPQFGDYVRSVVEQERKDSYPVSKKDWRIIKTADDQASINDGVARLNEKDALLTSWRAAT